MSEATSTTPTAPSDVKWAILFLALPLIVTCILLYFGAHLPVGRLTLTAEGITSGQYIMSSLKIALVMVLVAWIAFGLLNQKSSAFKATLWFFAAVCVNAVLTLICYNFTEGHSAIPVFFTLFDFLFVFLAIMLLSTNEVVDWFKQ